MTYLKEHWEMLSSFTVVIFGFGGLAQINREQGKKITKLELIIEEEIPKIREFMAKIDERTKHL